MFPLPLCLQLYSPGAPVIQDDGYVEYESDEMLFVRMESHVQLYHE